MSNEVTQWQHLSGEAAAGRLRLDESVGVDCLGACEQLLADFEDLARLAKQAQQVRGFGGFDSGHQLAAMYKGKGVGGVDSIDSVIEQHKQVVALIRDTISASVTRVGSQDDSSSQTISAIEPG